MTAAQLLGCLCQHPTSASLQHAKRAVAQMVVDFGSAFCSHCKAMLPHFLAASRKVCPCWQTLAILVAYKGCCQRLMVLISRMQHPKQMFVVASLDYMHVEAEVRSYIVYPQHKCIQSLLGQPGTDIVISRDLTWCSWWTLQGIVYTPTIAVYNKGKKVGVAWCTYVHTVEIMTSPSTETSAVSRSQ